MRFLLAIIAMLFMSIGAPIFSIAQTESSAVEKSVETDQQLADEIQKELEETFSSQESVEQMDKSPSDFLGKVLGVIKDFGGIPTILQISIIIMLIISSMKVSLLRELLWDRIGALKAWVPPLLGLVAGVLGLYGQGEVTIASAFAYMSAGAGAIILHELLNTVKAIPGIGPVYIQIINLIQAALKPKSQKK